MSKQKSTRSRGLNIRLLFILVTMVEILGTIALAGFFSALLEHFLTKSIEIHPVIWLLIFSVAIGVAVSVIVNIFLLRPVVRLSRAMKKVAEGDFTVQLKPDSHITEIRDSYQSFNLMVQALGATETLQSDFVSNVSHEFKTPINAIEGYSTLLQCSDDLSAEQQQYVEKIMFNTRRLSTLVGSILLLSKLDSQQISTGQTRFRLDEQIRQSIVTLEQAWEDKDIQLEVDLDLVEFLGSENMLHHVWDNLIGNAVKFSPQGGTIWIRLTQEGRTVRFTVEDRGPGIPEEAKKRIFDKFYQADSSHKQEGNGLGLALVKRIVAIAEGDIAVENVPEGGCRFTVTLTCP